MLLARVTTILPLCLQYILCPFRHASVRQLLSLMRVEAVKLAQAGFGDFLADTGVSRLKGKRDGNKEVYFVDTICNSAGHILKYKN